MEYGICNTNRRSARVAAQEKLTSYYANIEEGTGLSDGTGYRCASKYQKHLQSVMRKSGVDAVKEFQAKEAARIKDYRNSLTGDKKERYRILGNLRQLKYYNKKKEEKKNSTHAKMTRKELQKVEKEKAKKREYNKIKKQESRERLKEKNTVNTEHVKKKKHVLYNLLSLMFLPL